MKLFHGGPDTILTLLSLSLGCLGTDAGMHIWAPIKHSIRTCTHTHTHISCQHTHAHILEQHSKQLHLYSVLTHLQGHMCLHTFICTFCTSEYQISENSGSQKQQPLQMQPMFYPLFLSSSSFHPSFSSSTPLLPLFFLSPFNFFVPPTSFCSHMSLPTFLAMTF